MTKNSAYLGSRFFARLAVGCAAWATLASPAAAQQRNQQQAAPEVNVTDYGTVDLAVQDTDLSQVLEMLSIQGRKNIIVGSDVSATVSANLYDVTFYEALDAILSVNGFTYREQGNFIYVMTQEEMAELEAATRRTQSRIYELDYLSAADASEFIAPLLSESGRASARGDVQPGYVPDTSDGGADSYAYSAKVVVNDYPENLDAIEELLTELDTPPQQVLIEATVLQSTLDETNAYGLDFAVLADLDFFDLTDPLSAVDNLLAGDDAENGFQPGAADPSDTKAIGSQVTVGNTVGAGGLKVGVLTDEIAAFIRLLDEVTDATVLARPKVMALNRQRAEVLVGARVGFLSTTATETTTTQTVQFLDTGIQLVFRPFISRNGMIRLELSPSVSEASLRTVTDAQGLQVTIPDELTNELTTNVRIKDGQTLVLGGLFRESVRVTQRQVPFLGDIPVLGMAFTGQDDTVDRDEIIFLITPSLVNDEVLWDIGDEQLAYVDAVRVGARAGLLPFSRERVTGNYNRDALTAFREGDLDMAMHWTNTSLGLNPNQPEMIKLREELTGARDRTHDRSLMERAFRRVLGPLPAPKAEIPREVAGETSYEWLSDFEREPSGQSGETAPATETAPASDPLGWRDEPETGQQTGQTEPQKVSIVPARPQVPVAEHVPQMQPGRSFWPAEAAGSYGDPAWEASDPFVTFEDVAGASPGTAAGGGAW